MFGVIGQLLFGWLLADLIGGFFHWWEDRVGDADMPIIGRLVIAPNRNHHLRPAGVGAAPWGARLSVLAISAPLALGYVLLFGPDFVILGMVLGGALVNEVHGWAHNPTEAPPAVRLLQDTGIFQSPHHHAQHHRGAHDRGYCILTNWVNPWLDAVHFWSALEWGLSHVGLTPNKGTK